MIELIHGDCLEEMKKIESGSIDMILCDLPYGTTACTWDNIIPFDLLWKEYERIIKPNGAIVLTASQPFTSMLGMSNIKYLKYAWVWEKSRLTGHLNAKKRPLKNHEDVLVFYKNLPTFNPQGLVYSPRKVKNSKSDSLRGNDNKTSTISGGIKLEEYEQQYTNYPKQVLKFNNDGNTTHPTQKPVALFEYLIKTYTNEGDLVLDNCAGSFTTAEACFNTNRRCIAIEKEQKYYEVGIERMRKAKEKLGLFQTI